MMLSPRISAENPNFSCLTKDELAAVHSCFEKDAICHMTLSKIKPDRDEMIWTYSIGAAALAFIAGMFVEHQAHP